MGSSAASNQNTMYQPVGDGRPEDPERAVSTFRGDMIQGINLHWDDISFSVPGSQPGTIKQILSHCSGRVNKGEMCCIIGPSGAGKTTMLNILAGRVSAEWSGSVLADGVPVDPRRFSQQIAYVMQQEALFATATPREALHFSAAMRLPANTSVEARTRLVESLIRDLDLTKCADTYVGSLLIPGISGGEKKRTSVGVELITQPQIIFLDEPTSGLDTYSAYNLVRILKKLCAKGCSVVCTIHQPSSEIFHVFDKTILLESGHVVYHGSVKEMPGYFSSLGPKFECPPNYNPADHVMFLMQKKELKDDGSRAQMREAWAIKEKGDLKAPDVGEMNVPSGVESSDDVKKPMLRRMSSTYRVTYRAKAGLCKQFFYLFAREFRNTLRDKKTLTARVGLTVFLHVLYGMVFKGVGKSDDLHSRYGALLQLCVSAMFGCAQPMILTFPFERPVFIREYISGTYNVFPYFVSKALMEIPLALCQTLVGLLIGYYLIELQGDFIRLWMGLFLLGVVSSSVAVALGCATTNVKTAIETVPLVFVPQMLFAGFFVPIQTIPSYLRWSQWLCTLKYSINIMLLTEFTEDTPPVNALLHENTVKRDDLWFYVGMLLVLFFAFRMLGMIALSFRSQTQF
ncbi:hypothetical protein AAMO2058_000064500 [Amorphochlora amoebiformis]